MSEHELHERQLQQDLYTAARALPLEVIAVELIEALGEVHTYELARILTTKLELTNQ